MAHHDRVLFLEVPIRGKVIGHRVAHIVNDFLVDFFCLVLPGHGLVDGRSGERMRESVELVIAHGVVIQKLDHVSLLQLCKQCRRCL